MANYTLNYTGEEVDELLNKIDTAFGETTVMSDTLTWDGDTSVVDPVDPLGNGTMLLYHVSDVVPTMSDFANGAIVGFSSGNKLQLASSEVVSLGDGVLTNSNFHFVISPEDNLTKIVPYNGMNITVTLPKKGTYFGVVVGGSYTDTLTISGYTGFEMKNVTPIDKKYLPFSGVSFVDITGVRMSDMSFENAMAKKTFEEIRAMITQGVYVVARIIEGGKLAFAPVISVSGNDAIYFLWQLEEINVAIVMLSDNSIGRM